MSTYVVGDIHGCFDEWIALKNKIEDKDPEAVFILTGDIIDRGAKVYEMLTWAMKNITPDGKYQMIMGNHEFEKMEWLGDYFEYKKEASTMLINDMWPDNYDFYDICVHNNLSDEQLKSILNWFKQLPYYKEVYIDMEKKKQRFIVVHSFLPEECVNKDGSLKKRLSKKINDTVKRSETSKIKHSIVWYRNYFGNYYKNIIVVHGHTPTISKDCTRRGADSGRIWYTENDINVDCGLVFKKYYEEANLAAIRLEDLEEFYVYENEKPRNSKGRSAIYKQEMLEKRKRCQKKEDFKFSDEFIQSLW